MTDTSNSSMSVDELDEILKPWEDEIVSEYGTGINDDKKRPFIELAEAKQAIHQYVTKMQIEELKQVFQQPAYNAKGKHSTVLFYRSEYFEDRIAELEKQLEEWKQ